MDKPAKPIQAPPQPPPNSGARRRIRAPAGWIRSPTRRGHWWSRRDRCSSPSVRSRMHLDALPLMDLLHGLADPPPGKDLGLVLTPLHARSVEGREPPDLHHCCSTHRREREAAPSEGEGGVPVVLLASTLEREACQWSSSPPRQRGSRPHRRRSMEGEGLGRECAREREWWE